MFQFPLKEVTETQQVKGIVTFNFIKPKDSHDTWFFRKSEPEGGSMLFSKVRSYGSQHYGRIVWMSVQGRIG